MRSEKMDIEDEGSPHYMRENRQNINIQRDERCQRRLIVGAMEESFSLIEIASTGHYEQRIPIESVSKLIGTHSNLSKFCFFQEKW